MKNKHIIIYAEGSFQLGLGNIFRSISLANAIYQKDNSIRISFVTSSEQYIRNIISKQYTVFFSDSQEHAFQDIIRTKPDIVIIDYLGIDSRLVSGLRSNNIKVAIIGNNSVANQNANLVVNAIIGTNFENTDTTDSYGTRYLQGPKYLVLRDEFENKRGQYVFKEKLEIITLLFGGTDQANFSFEILKKLIKEQAPFNIKLILGAGYKNPEIIHTYVQQNKLEQQVLILQNIDNVSEELLSTDFLITSPGTSLFEAFCLGIPSLAFFQNESQEKVFNTFYSTLKFDPNMNLVEYVLSIYKNVDDFKKQLDKLSVGMGKNDIVNNLINL